MRSIPHIPGPHILMTLEPGWVGQEFSPINLTWSVIIPWTWMDNVHWTSKSSVSPQVSTKLRLQGNNCLCNWEGNKVSSRCEIDFDLICLATALLSTASCWWLCPDDNGRYLPGDWITGPSGTSLYNTPATQWRQPAPITSCWLKQAPLWIIHLFPHLKLVWFNWIFCATSYNVV